MIKYDYIVKSITVMFCFFKQKTAYEMRISDWSSDVCSSDLCLATALHAEGNDGATAPGHQLPAERVVGMVGQVRVQHPGDGVLALQDVEHLQGVGHVALDRKSVV